MMRSPAIEIAGSTEKTEATKWTFDNQFPTLKNDPPRPILKLSN